MERYELAWENIDKCGKILVFIPMHRKHLYPLLPAQYSDSEHSQLSDSDSAQALGEGNVYFFGGFSP